MGNLVSYKGEILAIYYLEKIGGIEGYTFVFEDPNRSKKQLGNEYGIVGLKILLNAPDDDRTDEGPTIRYIKDMLSDENKCFGIFLSAKQRIINRSK